MTPALLTNKGTFNAVPILEEKLGGIRALCQVFHVLQLDAFGAIIDDDFDPSHDVASFVIKSEPANVRVQYERFFGLLQGLEVLLECRIDLIDYKALIERSIVQQVPEDRLPVYVAKKQA